MPAVVVADGAVRVHRHAGRARPAQLRLHLPRRLRERLVDLAEGERARVGDVRAELLVHERRAVLPRLERVEHDRQRLVLDLDQVARVLGDVAVLGDHRRDRLAVVAHLLDRDHVLDDRAGAERGQRRRALGDVGAGDDAITPGSASAFDVSMRTMRACACGLRTIAACAMLGELDVVDVAALAAQEARILDAVDALAEPAARGRPSAPCRARSSPRRDPARCVTPFPPPRPGSPRRSAGSRCSGR